jgi:hypothetical protein
MSVRKANRVEITILTPKISGPFWRILGLKYVLIDMCGNDQNELYFSTSNCKIMYLTMTIVCRKNLNQSNLMDCKIITIEGECMV